LRLPAFSVLASLIAFFMIMPVGFNSAVSNARLDRVDIGSLDGYDGANPWGMVGWGPVEPKTHGGAWGDIAAEKADCRVVWSPHYDSADYTDENWAAVTMWIPAEFQGSIQCIKMRVLDGQADDSFEVSVFDPCDGVDEVVYTYTADPSTSEDWIVHTIWIPVDEDGRCVIPHGAPVYATSGFQMTIKALGSADDWTYFDPFGMLAIDWIELYGNGQAPWL